jgi:putative copper export protein
MHDRLTRRRYAAGLQLAVGVGAFMGALALLLVEPTFMGGTGRRMLDEPLVVAAFVAAAVGLVWMGRILRGPRDEPPPWRYRDR